MEPILKVATETGFGIAEIRCRSGINLTLIEVWGSCRNGDAEQTGSSGRLRRRSSGSR